MFYYISGKVAAAEAGLVVLDAGGVGYAINTSYPSARTVKVGEQALFYTFLRVAENIFELYGFVRRDELDCFKQLVTISGVGPRVALAILGTVTPEKLALCVISGDEKALTAAPGVGKKLAQRILLELKDKIAKAAGEELEELAVSANVAEPVPQNSNREAAVSALIVLGYTRPEAVKAVSGVTESGLSTEEIIRQALKNT